MKNVKLWQDLRHKRSVAILTILMLILQLLPVAAFADDENNATNGNDTETQEWTLYQFTDDDYTDFGARLLASRGMADDTEGKWSTTRPDLLEIDEKTGAVTVKGYDETVEVEISFRPLIKVEEPTEPGSTEPEQTEPKPTEPGSAEPEQTEPKPTEPGSAEPEQTEPKPTEPGSTEPEQTEPKPTEPGSTEPEQTEPKPTEPGSTEPEQTEPKPTEPGSTEPEQTEPKPTESGSTEPEQTEPKPTESGSTEPEQTEPKPTESGSTEPEQTVLEPVEASLNSEEHSANAKAKVHKLEETEPPLAAEPDVTPASDEGTNSGKAQEVPIAIEETATYGEALTWTVRVLRQEVAGSVANAEELIAALKDPAQEEIVLDGQIALSQVTIDEISEEDKRSDFFIEITRDVAIRLNGHSIGVRETFDVSDYKNLSMFRVKNGATLTIKGNGTIQGNDQIVHGVYVEGGGTFNLGTSDSKQSGGTIKGFGMNQTAIPDIKSANGGGIFGAENSKINIYSGTITENRARSGGGIYAAARSKVNISGGSITNNQAVMASPRLNGASQAGNGYGGGGIFGAGELNISGDANISYNTAVGGGGGIMIGIEAWGDGVSKFTMTGGTISHNTAGDEGGGIFLRGLGKITGGTIEDNTTKTTVDWGGGGIFVQSGCILEITNALITDNTAKGWGGGVAGCTHGDIFVLDTSGAAVYENISLGTTTAPEGSADTVTDKENAKDYYCSKNSLVLGEMLGEGDANWHGEKRDAGNSEREYITLKKGEQARATRYMCLTAEPSPGDKAKAKAIAENGGVIISGNTSYTHGGGLTANGTVILGTKSNTETFDHFKITAKKIWETPDGAAQPAQKFVLLNAEPSVDENNNITFNKDDVVAEKENDVTTGEVSFELDSRNVCVDKNGKLVDDDTYTFYLLERSESDLSIDYSQRVYKIVVVMENEIIEQTSVNTIGTQKTTKFTNHKITMQPPIAYEVVDGELKQVDNWNNESQLTFTNVIGRNNLVVSKTVEGNAGEDGEDGRILRDFDFRLYLTLPDGLSVNDADISFKNSDGKKGKVTELNLVKDDETGKLYYPFALHDDQSIAFHVPDGTAYEVVEVDANTEGYKTIINGQPKVDTATLNRVEFINTRNVADLIVQKLVTGEGADENGRFGFTVTLTVPQTAKAIAEQMKASVGSDDVSIVSPTDGGYIYTIDATLGNEDQLVITGIPAGTEYKVVEPQGNADGYSTFINKEGTASAISGKEISGVIDSGNDSQDVKIAFTNHRGTGLAISKTVSGSTGEQDRDFTFRVILTDASGQTLTGSYSYSGSGKSDTITSGGTITLKHGERVIISGLPQGTHYEVVEVEANADGYTTTATGTTGTISGGTSVPEAAFTNTRGGGDEPGPGPEEPPTTPEEPPTTPDIPVYTPGNTPDPNDPDSPDVIIIDDGDVPLAYVKTPDPDNPEEFVYLPDPDIPLATVPRTGDGALGWLLAAMASGLALLGLSRRKAEK